ncbi:MAG: hypothetical protein ACR2LS_02670, partial [Thermomicrobiales bacterium]
MRTRSDPEPFRSRWDSSLFALSSHFSSHRGQGAFRFSLNLFDWYVPKSRAHLIDHREAWRPFVVHLIQTAQVVRRDNGGNGSTAILQE